MERVARFALFLLLWLVLAGFDPSGLPFGLLAAGCATWASLALLPPGPTRLQPGALLRLSFQVVTQSLTAGIDIALRALNPALPLRPGLVHHPLVLAPGVRQDSFRALASLAPGALPTGVDEAGRLVVHVLDAGLPVSRDLAAMEALFLPTQVPHG